MPRIPREDSPGTWHHVMNRAIARRTLFETRQDFRFFLARLADEVRRGEIEIHAYCLMGTHYHLLLRSLRGHLAEVMQRVQLAYSRWFNRSRRRDGSLFRGRYRSKPVRSLEYRRILVRYIDDNARKAGLVGHPSAYPWGSAWHYARSDGPPWLERSWVESEVELRSGREAYRPEDYMLAFPNGEGLAGLVETRLRGDETDDGLDDLVSSSSQGVQNWMLRKARLADGTKPGQPVLSIQHLAQSLDERAPEDWIVRRACTRRSAKEVAFVGLARDLSGLRISEIADRIEASETKTRNLYRLHAREMKDGSSYAERVASIVVEALRRMRGVRR